MKRLLAVLTVLLLAGVFALAQESTAGQDVKTAGKKTAGAAKSAASATKKETTKAADKVTGKIDVNSASKEDLMKLEGVGDATADKIIAGRPYATKRDLLNKKIVSASEYDKIKEKIVAHGGTSSSKSTKVGTTTTPPK